MESAQFGQIFAFLSKNSARICKRNYSKAMKNTKEAVIVNHLKNKKTGMMSSGFYFDIGTKIIPHRNLHPHRQLQPALLL